MFHFEMFELCAELILSCFAHIMLTKQLHNFTHVQKFSKNIFFRNPHFIENLSNLRFF